MDLKSIGGAIAGIAPTIATMLGGPLAGQAVSALTSILGVKTSDEVAQAIQQQSLTGDQIVAIKKADQDFQTKMRELDIDVAKVNADFQTNMIQADVADRSSARLRESSVKDWTPRILAAVVVTLVLCVEGSVFFFGTPKDTDPVIVGRILGTLDTALVMVLAYYFGSSAGASRGQELLAQAGPVTKPIEVTSK